MLKLSITLATTVRLVDLVKIYLKVLLNMRVDGAMRMYRLYTQLKCKYLD